MRLKLIIIAIAMMMVKQYAFCSYSLGIAPGDSFEQDGLKYCRVSYVEDAAVLVGHTLTADYSAPIGLLEIPGQVTDGSGKVYNVVGMGSSALGGLSIIRLILPSTIGEIDGHAFNDIAQLEYVGFKSGGLKVVGPEAFSGVSVGTYETVVELPEGVVAICNDGFRTSCAYRLILPSTLEYVGVRALAGNYFMKRIVLKAVEPPVADGAMFGSYIVGPTNLYESPIMLDRCVLAVPQESIDKYRAAPGWSLFTHIEAMTPEEAAGIAPPSPVSERASVSVSSGRGCVAVMSPQAVDVRILDVRGRVVAAAKVNGSRSFNLPQGIYFVATPARNLKVKVD